MARQEQYPARRIAARATEHQFVSRDNQNCFIPGQTRATVVESSASAGGES